jgi:hypothetical protein
MTDSCGSLIMTPPGSLHLTDSKSNRARNRYRREGPPQASHRIRTSSRAAGGRIDEYKAAGARVKKYFSELPLVR